MRDPPAALLLRACRDMGLLSLRDLFVETALIANNKTFTSAEIVAHSLLPANRRLQAAIQAACGGEVSGRKLGRVFARWEAIDIAGLRVDCVGRDPLGIVWSIVSTEKDISNRTACADSGIVVALPPLTD